MWSHLIRGKRERESELEGGEAGAVGGHFERGCVCERKEVSVCIRKGTSVCVCVFE